jgi:DNA-binding NarL/FixJ family response regulator
LPAAPSGPEQQTSVTGPSTGENPYDLTATEFAILGLLTEGLSNLGIAKRRGIQEGTVKIHLSAIFRVLDVNNRTEAVLAAQQLSLDLGSDAANR